MRVKHSTGSKDILISCCDRLFGDFLSEISQSGLFDFKMTQASEISILPNLPKLVILLAAGLGYFIESTMLPN